MIAAGNPRLTLASSSPRRKALLTMLGLSFDIMEPNVSESLTQTLTPDTFVEVLANRKAEAAVQMIENQPAVIVAADTIVSIHGELLAKPKDKHEAYATLQRLQGTVHDVYTGLCVVDTALRQHRVLHVRTKVSMRRQDDAFLRWYVDTLEPMDKAGSYGIQGKGSLLVHRIEGDYFNVVGLPLFALAETLESLGRPIYGFME